ncbi:MAG: YjjG family noncanonical pyrimidine nucleotidase [Clostridia bacterium]|nr:YjjG family noncanonical pyrimidine nucleotidase [Clostridia bacterium]
MKKKYDIVLFDADRTLYDFDRGEENALRTHMTSLGIDLTEEMYGAYKKINKSLWDEFEQGKREKQTIAPTRFLRFFEKFSIDFDPNKSAREYLELLGEQRFLIPGAYGLCESLFAHVDMYIVTNGIGSVQEKRFSKSELAPFFKGVFISENLGAAKPDPEFYSRALALIGNPEKDRILAVGDSPEADIRGANLAGIDACFYSPEKTPLPPGIQAKYTVSTLSEIGKILL